jgi:signal peptidase I
MVKSIKPFVREIIITVAIALVLFLVARLSIQTYEVFQTSMEPNFFEGQRVVVNKATYWFGGPQRGDVVILKSPNSDEEFIKRIIGLPDDTVEIISGQLYINGTAIDEPYVINSFTYSMQKLTIPEESYFVLGDNRDISNDSHNGWLLPEADVIGKAWLITWPPSDWGTVPAYRLSEQLPEAEAQTYNFPDSESIPVGS